MAPKDRPNQQNIRQSVDVGSISTSGGDVNISQVANQHGATINPTTPTEFIEALHSVIAELDKVKATEVAEAKKELVAATEEAKKAAPQGSVLRRFLFSAKGLLEGIAGVATPVATLGELIKKVPGLFGN
jgi:hypothetical protein